VSFVYIYRVGDRNVFKIGKATNVSRRLRAHATSSAERLSRFDVIETEHPSEVEKYLKHRLRSKRYAGSDATEIYEVDPDELASLIADARQYDAEVLPMILEADRLSHEPCDDTILQPTREVLDTYSALVEVQEKIDTLGYDKDRLKSRLQVSTGTASGIEQVANWKTVLRRSFDTNGFKLAQPEVYAAFVREVPSRPFILL
jgi:hypothetical protein